MPLIDAAVVRALLPVHAAHGNLWVDVSVGQPVVRNG
jgi:hypothetical protein